ncbi:hypothetical protein SAMN04488128_103126 [Chitinophaga eiseniae]|uniref:Rhodanese-like domain-containing protein n=1 Tax=Chitinophaga eiseniae TaxID=634771 RepID=A0A1T4SMF7_9BACT|nr:hypothetical protein [Chitinophaga eiseniae]SKA29484.1 hypothetical protein SAMN04488128_103126 [Chitinophaga eiseniae]
MNKQCLIILLIVILSAGCMPEASGPVARKKLPPDEQKLPVHLADPANDEALVNLLNTYRPLAIPMLTKLAKEQRGGIVIDLRADESMEPLSAAYLIRKDNVFSIPVQLVWDGRSASRAAYFLKLANGYKEVNITRISEGFSAFRSDCFNF